MLALAAAFALALPASSAPRPLSVMCYNTAGHPFVYRRMLRRFDALGPRLRGSGLDVIGLEEVWMDWLVPLLKKGAGYPALRPKGRWLGSGLLLLTKLEVVKWSFTPFVPTTPPHRAFKQDADGLSRKGVLSVRLKTEDGEVDLHLTHLVADLPPMWHVTTRIAQIYEMYRAVRDFSGDRPYLLMGDMNYDAGGAEAKVADELMGLRDVCLEKGKDVCGPTFDERRIDYIYLHGPWKILSAGLGMSKPVEGLGLLSDHKAGIRAELLPPSGAGPEPDLKRRRAALVEIIHRSLSMADDLDRQYRTRWWIPLYNLYFRRWTHDQAAHLRGLAVDAAQELKALGPDVIQ